MADAKITGILDQAAISISKTDDAGVKTTTKSFGEDLNGVSELGVSGSEDLGNGLTATYGINLSMNIATGGNSPGMYNGTGVGLKGPFGAVTIGTSYNLNFFTNAMADASGFAGVSVGQLNGNAGGLKSNILTYTAPTFVPGLSLAAEMQRGGTTSNAGNMTGYMAQYDTGGLMVRYSTSTKTEAASAETFALTCGDSTCTTATVVSSTSNQMTSSASGGFSGALAARTALDKTKANAIAVTYDFGVAKAFYGSSTIKSNTTVAQIKSSTTGVSVPLGALTLSYAASSEKATADGTGVDSGTAVLGVTTSGDVIESSGSRLLATYALSKRTTLYGMSGKQTMDSAAGEATSLKTTTTSVGVKHAF
jgi:predicted porin